MPCDITKKDMELAVSNTQVQIFLEEYAVTGQAAVVRAPKGYSAHMQYIVPAPFCGRAPIAPTTKPGTCNLCAVRQLIAKSLLGLPQQKYGDFFTRALLL